MDTPLKSIPLFVELQEEELASIASHAVTKRFPKNTIIIHDGDETNSLYIIQKGKVRVFLSNDEGKEIILNTLGPGDYFGELSLLDNAPRSASIITTEPCQFNIITKQDFETSMDKHPQMARTLIRALTADIRRLTESVRSLALMDVYGRVARILLDLAEPEEPYKVINQKLTHQDIARMIGSSREMVSRIMKDLERGGYVQTEGKRLVIKNRLPHAW